MSAALVFVGLWSGIAMWPVLVRPDRVRRPAAVQASARIGPAAPAGPQIVPVPWRSEPPVGV
jgi:hypothetical protein